MLFSFFVLAAMVGLAGLTPPPVPFPVSDLAAWTPLSASETVPYREEGLQSEFLFGARSPNGSYIFVTRIDNSLRRPAPDAQEVRAYASPEAYAHLQPTAFRTELAAVDSAGARHHLTAAVVTYETRHLPYDLGPEPALVRTVFLPLVLQRTSDGMYFNQIYVANYRGAEEMAHDLGTFDSIWRRLEIASGDFSVVPLEVFNALQPRLGDQQRAQPVEDGGSRAARLRGSGPGAPARGPDAVAAALLRALGGSADFADHLELMRLAAAYPATALARVIARLERNEALALQAAIWRRAFEAATEIQRAQLAGHLLIESARLGDRETAAAVSQAAAAASVSVAQLPCAELAELARSLLDHPESAMLEGLEDDRFFTLDSEMACSDLVGLLQAQGAAIPGVRELVSGRGWAASSSPQLAHRDGTLVRVQPTEGGKRRGFQVTAVSSLPQAARLVSLQVSP